MADRYFQMVRPSTPWAADKRYAEMLNRDDRWPWILMLLCCAIGVGLGAFAFRPAPERGETVYLPGKTVVKKVVDEQTLNEMAARDATIASLGIKLDETGRRLRDAQGRLVAVQERLEAVSHESTATPEAVEVIEQAAADGTVADLIYRGRIVAFKFYGKDQRGRQTAGWAGHIICEVQHGSDFKILSAQQFNLQAPATSYQGLKEPPRPHLHRWYGTVQYALIRDATDFYDFTVSPDRVRLELGRRWFPAKRYAIRTGVWGDTSALGVSLGVDF